MLHFDIVNTLLSLTGNVLTLQFVLFVGLYIPYGSSSTPINVVIITDCNNLLGTVTYAVFYKAFSGLLSCSLVGILSIQRNLLPLYALLCLGWSEQVSPKLDNHVPNCTMPQPENQTLKFSYSRRFCMFHVSYKVFPRFKETVWYYVPPLKLT